MLIKVEGPFTDEDGNRVWEVSFYHKNGDFIDKVVVDDEDLVTILKYFQKVRDENS